MSKYNFKFNVITPKKRTKMINIGTKLANESIIIDNYALLFPVLEPSRIYSFSCPLRVTLYNYKLYT